MAVIVLISGTGFTVKKMVCLQSGKIKTAFYSLNDCCTGKKKEQKNEEQLNSNCCKYSSESFFLDHNATEKAELFKKMDIGDAVQLFITPYTFNAIARTVPVHSFADLPPPIPGRERLILISTFLI